MYIRYLIATTALVILGGVQAQGKCNHYSGRTGTPAFGSDNIQRICQQRMAGSGYTNTDNVECENNRIDRTIDAILEKAHSIIADKSQGTITTANCADLVRQNFFTDVNLDLRGIEVDVRVLKRIDNLTSLNLSNTLLTNKDLEYLGSNSPRTNLHLRSLTSINVSDNDITSLEGLLAGYPNLGTIDASDNNIKSLPNVDPAANLSYYRKISVLKLANNPQLSDSGIQALMGYGVNLVYLDVSKTSVRSLIDISKPSRVKSLSFLTMNGNDFSGAAPLPLNMLPKLSYLSIRESKGFDMSAFNNISSHQTLYLINLSDSAVANAGSGVDFSGFSALGYLILENVSGLSKVSGGDVKGISIYDTTTDLDFGVVGSIDNRGSTDQPKGNTITVSSSPYVMDQSNASRAKYGDNLSALLDEEYCRVRDSNGLCIENAYECHDDLSLIYRGDGQLNTASCGSNDLFDQSSNIVVTQGTQVQFYSPLKSIP